MNKSKDIQQVYTDIVDYGTGKKFEPHCLRVQVQFLISTVQKRGNVNAESKIMQISQIMKNRDWLINVNRYIDQNQSSAYIGKHAYLILS